MIDKTLTTEAIFLFSLCAGIVLIIFSIIWSGRLKNRPPVEIVLSKLGINLKLDTLALLILVGVLIAGGGGFFLYQSYEGRLESMTLEYRQKLESMKIDLDNTSVRLTTLEDTVKEFKDYDLTFKLDFWGPIEDLPNYPETEIIAYLRRKGEKDYITYDKIIIEKDKHGINVEVGDLRPGDTVRLNAKNEDKTWVSQLTKIPEARIIMTQD